MELEHEKRIRELIDLGFDTFIGRRIGTNGTTEYHGYAHMTLRSLGCTVADISQRNLKEFMFKLLIRDVKEGRKILLTKSPGHIPPIEDISPNWVDLLRREFTRDNSIPIRQEWGVSYPETYLTFNYDELKLIEREYEKRTDLKIFPNPFLYQPE